VTRARSRWYDGAWPVLAGLAAGAGLVSTYLWTGLLVSAIALTVLELTIAPIAWCVLTELGHSATRVALRVAPTIAVAILAMTGLGEAIGTWAFLVGGTVLATSPLLRGWTRLGVRRTLAEHVSPRTETRRRFDEIVAGFGPEDELSG
jgi:hypothetical protein